MQEYRRLQFANGYAEAADVGRIMIRRYVGKFETPLLQGKADTGCWYVVGIVGTPAGSTYGEGDSPRAAVADAVKRKREELRRMEEMYTALTWAEDFGLS